jgi:branched-subunit amino acid aminotransferase/4-amino-4-deoxychorismate lyase
MDSKGGIASPPKEDILVGCTLLAVEKLLLKNDVRIQYRDIEAKELASASEIILTGSSGGVWFAGSVDGDRIGTSDRPMTRLLTELWKKHVGMDYIAQAAQCGRPYGNN